MAPPGGSTHFVPPAEQIAIAVYATDGTLGGVPALDIAAPGGRSRWLPQSPEPGDHRSP